MNALTTGWSGGTPPLNAEVSWTTSSSLFLVCLVFFISALGGRRTRARGRGAKFFSDMSKDIPKHQDIEKVKSILPHRYPFLLIDKVVEHEGAQIVGIKQVTANEQFFEGHFPDQKVMPGVLQVEALAQLAGIALLQTEATEGGIFFFGGVNKVKWKKPVVPGDTLVLEAEILSYNPKFKMAKAKGKGYVNGQVVVEVGEMTFALSK